MAIIKKFKAEYSIFHNSAHKENNGKTSHQYTSREVKETPDKQFDLRNPLKISNLQNRVILLAGPPGTGKTTVARVIARHCGYEPIEVNASDDRNSERLMRVVRNITETDTLNKSKKPSLLIIDEVDGATESSNNSAVNEILDYIYRKETKTNGKPKPDEENNENDEIPSVMKMGKRDLKIKRPIIFICNDLYAKGLRQLHKKALIFKFRKAPRDRILQRLKEICIEERFYVDHKILNQICEVNDDDIRSCLNLLEIAAKTNKGNDFLVSQSQNNKDVDVNLLEIISYLTSKSSESDKISKRFPYLLHCEKRGKFHCM